MPTSNATTTTSTAAPAVEARNLYKSYRMGRLDVPVLRGVTLAIQTGECVAVLGASGSGKSTLLHLLGGLDRPSWSPRVEPKITDPGHVRFNGKPLPRAGSNKLDQYRTNRVGFVFQFYHLLPELNVVENVTVPARLGHNPISWINAKPKATERAHDLLQRFGLEHRLKHRPAELSGGERQRVAIARALINQPDLLLADEPTGNLDQNTGASILDALMQLRAESNQTMVIVTHDHDTAGRADRTVNLRDGLVVEQTHQ